MSGKKYVGVAAFEQWLSNARTDDKTVEKFLADFDISNELCQSIMQEVGVYEYYDMEAIFALRENT